jgi:phosphinothricin acetyltransferase
MLINRCGAGEWHQMVAVIGDIDNEPSTALHRHLGFYLVGTLQALGYKFDRWVDTLLL